MTYSSFWNITYLSNVEECQRREWVRIQAVKNAQDDALGWRSVAVETTKRLSLAEVELNMANSSLRAHIAARENHKALVEWLHDRHPEIIQEIVQENKNADPQRVPTKREDVST